MSFPTFLVLSKDVLFFLILPCLSDLSPLFVCVSMCFLLDFGAEVPLVDLRPNGAPVRYYAVEASWKFPLNSTCKLLQVASCKWCWSYHNIDLIIIYYINWIIYIILIKVMYYEYTTYSIYIETQICTRVASYCISWGNGPASGRTTIGVDSAFDRCHWHRHNRPGLRWGFLSHF